MSGPDSRELLKFLSDLASVEAFIAEAGDGPQCFECHEAIANVADVRIVTVRAEGKPLNVWMHADHVGEPS